MKAGAHENVHRTGRTAAVDGLAQIATSPPGTALGGDCIAVQSKEMAGMTSCAEILAPPVHLLTAWRHDPAMHPNQLVHAVEPGGHVAECGVEVAVFGRPWPDPGTGTLQSRCSICAQAVEGAWVGSGQISNVR